MKWNVQRNLREIHMNVGGIIGVVIGSVVFLLLVIAFYFSYSLLYPMKQPIKETPKDYGIKFENISFNTEDDIELKGWLIPAESENLIIKPKT